MSDANWVIATRLNGLAAAVAILRDLGPVSVLVLGDADLAQRAAGTGAERVAWLNPGDDVPADAYAAAVGSLLHAEHPSVVAATSDPSGRALLGAVAGRLAASVVAGVRQIRVGGAGLLLDHAILDGAVIETVSTSGPVAITVGVPDESVPPVSGGVPEMLELSASPARILARRAGEQTSGVRDAARVVSFGRGLKRKEDVVLVRALATALDAELACSMPVADDLGWLEKSRYVGRSGQRIAPRLYLAVGISGAPQHLEGISGAKVVVAINSDPDAPIFRAARYGIVADLYDVVPALTAALTGQGRP